MWSGTDGTVWSGTDGVGVWLEDPPLPLMYLSISCLYCSIVKGALSVEASHAAMLPYSLLMFPVVNPIEPSEPLMKFK